MFGVLPVIMENEDIVSSDSHNQYDNENMQGTEVINAKETPENDHTYGYR